MNSLSSQSSSSYQQVGEEWDLQYGDAYIDQDYIVLARLVVVPLVSGKRTRLPEALMFYRSFA